MAEQHFDAAESGGPDGVAGMSAVDIADWRLRTFALYATVRKIAADSPAEAHTYWRQERDRMTHKIDVLSQNRDAITRYIQALETAGSRHGTRERQPA